MNPTTTASNPITDTAPVVINTKLTPKQMAVALIIVLIINRFQC